MARRIRQADPDLTASVDHHRRQRCAQRAILELIDVDSDAYRRAMRPVNASRFSGTPGDLVAARERAVKQLGPEVADRHADLLDQATSQRPEGTFR